MQANKKNENNNKNHYIINSTYHSILDDNIFPCNYNILKIKKLNNCKFITMLIIIILQN